MPVGIGVDLGTWKSVVAICQLGDDRPEVIPNDVGGRSTPSVMAVLSRERLVGEAAVMQAPVNPTKTIRNVKSVLGKSFERSIDEKALRLGAVRVSRDQERDAISFQVDDQDIAPEEVSAMILGDLCATAAQHVPKDIEEDGVSVVIAVPSYFTSPQRRATLDAGRIVGVKNASLINETTAAALVYASDERREGKIAMIVDVGGGGGAVSVVRVVDADGTVDVLACSGRRLPGGIDMDVLMLNYLAQIIYKSHQFDVVDHDRALEILQSSWQKTKMKLSRLPEATLEVFLPGADIDFKHTITSEDFGMVCRNTFKSAFKSAINDVLQEARVPGDSVGDVVLVGGASRTSWLKDLLRDVNPCRIVNADEGVACGAALYGAWPRRLRKEVSPHRVWISAQKGDVPPFQAFPRNVVVPSSRIIDMPSSCTVVGEGHDFDYCFTIIEKTCEDQNMQKKSHPLQCTVRKNINGIVAFHGSQDNVSVTDAYRTCLSKQRRLKVQQRAEEQVDFLKDHLERLKAKNELEETCREILKQKKGLPICSQEHQFLLSMVDCTLQWLNVNAEVSIEDYRSRLDTINDLTCEMSAREVSQADLSALQETDARHTLESVQQPTTSSAPLPLSPDFSTSHIRTRQLIEVDNDSHIEAAHNSTRVCQRLPRSCQSSGCDLSCCSCGREVAKTVSSRQARASLSRSQDSQAVGSRTATPKTNSSLSLGQSTPAGLLQEMFQVLHHQVVRGEELVWSSSFCKPEVATLLAEHCDVALNCLAAAVQQTIAREVRAAGRAALLVDTMAVGPAEHVTSVMLRYCQGGGVIVERLIALVPAEEATPDRLLSAIEGVCKNWRNILGRGSISFDAAPSMRRQYEKLIAIVRGACGHSVRVVWNSSHRLSDIIVQACSGNKEVACFFGALDLLEDFFGREGRLSRWTIPTGKSTFPCFESYEKIVEILSDKSCLSRTLQLLTDIGHKADGQIKYLCSKLAESCSSHIFKGLCELFSFIFSLTADLSLQPANAQLCNNTLLKVLMTLRNIAQAPLQTSLSDTLSFRFSLHTHVPSVFEEIVNRTINCLEAPISESVKDLMKMESLMEMAGTDCSSDPQHFSPSVMVSWTHELKEMGIGSDKILSASDFVKQLLKQCERRREHFREKYETVFSCAQALCTVPLIPATTGPSKLSILRERLRGKSFSSQLEPVMVVVCAFDNHTDMSKLDGDEHYEQDYNMAMQIFRTIT